MEALEQMIRDIRRWLKKVGNRDSEVSQRQLARLDTSERVLRHIRPQNKTDTHNETYQGICGIFLGNIVRSTRVALISKETDNKSQEKSDTSEKLPIVGEIKDYLKDLESKNNEIDRVMNQIKEMLEKRDYKLTEKERIKVKRLLLDVEAKSQQAEIYVEAAEKALESLPSEVDSYEKEQSVSGWDVFVPAVVCTAFGAAAVVGAILLPVVAPAAAAALYGGGAIGGGAIGVGAIGGGAIGGIGGLLYRKNFNKGECKELRKEGRELKSRLRKRKTALAAKQPDIESLAKFVEK